MKAIIIAAAVIVPALSLYADPSAYERIKFEQAPMLATVIGETNYYGHDEESWAFQQASFPPTNLYTGLNWMADDFADTVNHSIVHVEWWGSYIANGTLGTPPLFLIEFLSDLPDSDGDGPDYSRPRTILSSQVVTLASSPGHPAPGTYTVDLEPGSNPGELVYRYNAHLRQPFFEQADTVYWLKILALQATASAAWGWHSRDYTKVDPYAFAAVGPGERVTGIVDGTNVWHFQDDAVVSISAVGVVVNTQTLETVIFFEDPTNAVPMSYISGVDGPPGIQTNSKDLAFTLYYENEMCPKWIQEPDCDLGLDVASYGTTSDGGERRFIADDFVSDGRPIAGLSWWGSYQGWMTNAPGPVAPPPLLSSLHPYAFRLTWYEDIPASEPGFSHPGEILAQDVYPIGTFGEPANYGVVSEDWYCDTDLSNFFGGASYEHEYAYSVAFTNGPWNEKEGHVYWVSVEALYPIAPPSGLWGWKTTAPAWNWNDDAVFVDGSVTNELLYPPPGWAITNHPYAGLSVNMAFHLLTDVCPARCKKWSQPPEPVAPDDIETWVNETNKESGILLADDFISDGRPITDIHWWGSYLGWSNTVPAGPVPPPSDPALRPTGFFVRWADSSTEDCAPSNLLAEVFVPMNLAHEVYYSTVDQYWKDPQPSFEHEYQYYVDLMDPTLGGTPWYETNGVPYWLSVQAVFPSNFVPSQETHYGWGWKMAKLPNTHECPSVYSDDGGTTWHFNFVPFGHPSAGLLLELSFELTTPNIPVSNSVIAVQATFTNVHAGPIVGVDLAQLSSTGTCGCGKQILQTSSNLLLDEAGWVDVMTNSPPRPSTTWLVPAPSTSQFYRIKQTD